MPQVCSQDSIPGVRVVPTQCPALPPLSHPRGRKDPLYLKGEGQGTEGELEGSDRKVTLIAVLVPLGTRKQVARQRLKKWRGGGR